VIKAAPDQLVMEFSICWLYKPGRRTGPTAMEMRWRSADVKIPLPSVISSRI